MQKDRYCKYCESDNIREYLLFNGYIIYRCDYCGILFTQTRSNSIYSNNKKTYDLSYLENYNKRFDILKSRFIKVLEEIEIIQPGGYLLDVGCSTGIFLRVVIKYCKYKWDLWGVDINTKSIQFANKIKGIKLINKSIENTNISRDKFDCITCFDILEHTADIRKTMEKLNIILKKNGLLVIQVPNYKSTMALLCGNNWDWWSIPDHRYHFCETTIKNILLENGFRIIRLYTWSPKKEFIKNISGSIRNRMTKKLYLNRIFGKITEIVCSYMFGIEYFCEKVFNIGSLLIIYATK